MTIFLALSAETSAAVAALGTVGTFLVAAIAAVIALRQLALERRLREEQARPYVVVSVEPSPASRHMLDLVIANIGKTSAFEVSVHLDPPPVRAREFGEHRLAKARMLTEPIALLPPSGRMTMFFENILERHHRDDLPTTYNAEVAYRNSVGRSWVDRYPIDLAAGRGAPYVSVFGLHDAVQALRDIGKTLEKFALLQDGGIVPSVASEICAEPSSFTPEQITSPPLPTPVADQVGDASGTPTKGGEHA